MSGKHRNFRQAKKCRASTRCQASTQLSGRHPTTRQKSNVRQSPNMPQCPKICHNALNICHNAPKICHNATKNAAMPPNMPQCPQNMPQFPQIQNVKNNSICLRLQIPMVKIKLHPFRTPWHPSRAPAGEKKIVPPSPIFPSIIPPIPPLSGAK